MKFNYLLAFLVSILFFACADQETLTTASSDGDVIQSKADFQNLADNNTYPLNLLSTEALNHFKSQLLFVDGNEFKGGDYSMIRAELNDEQFAAFWAAIVSPDVYVSEKDIAVDRLVRDKVILDRRPSDCYPTNVQTYCVMIPPN